MSEAMNGSPWAKLLDHLYAAQRFHVAMRESRSSAVLHDMVSHFESPLPLPTRYAIDPFGRIELHWGDVSDRNSVRVTICGGEASGVIVAGRIQHETRGRSEDGFTLPRVDVVRAARLLEVLVPMVSP